MGNMFDSASAFNRDIGDWDVSIVTDMYGMFEQAPAFNQDISTWNVSSVTMMKNMFEDASSFNQPLNPPPEGGWNVSNVTTMVGMFSEASAFYQDISNWNTSSAVASTSMYTDSAMENKNSYKAPNT
tara:strand:+ start:118 stop:498 length:381 start_codon:yes stop_codon:yes gene_type:complete